MKITPDLVKDYLFGEGIPAERRQMESALAADPALREELSRLQFTETALFSLRDEEMPRRIAFVSDKVFEPKRWQIWLNSGPRMALASACVVALALVAHGVMQPAPILPAAPTPSAEIDRRIAGEVTRAVAAALEQTEARHRNQLAATVRGAEERYRKLRQEDIQIVEANYRLWREKEAKKKVDFAMTQWDGSR